MSSAVSLRVITPDGRSLLGKVKGASPGIQVLEEVCRKQSFNPEEYSLKFQRNILDLSQQWRFANVPNNGKLEMVPAARQGIGMKSTVRIALQLEDGSRLQHHFQSNCTLWDLLNHFPQTRVSEQHLFEATPVCVYMRDEISGQSALKKTTLRLLGLTSGSAIIRYVLKKSRPDEPMDLAVVSEGQPVRKTSATKDVDGFPSEPNTSDHSVKDSNSNGLTEAVASRTVELSEGNQDGPPKCSDNEELSQETADVLQTKENGSKLSTDQISCVGRRSVSPGKAAVSKTGTSSERPDVPELGASCTPHENRVPFVPFKGGGQQLGGSEAGGEKSPSDKMAPRSVSSPGGPPLPKKSKPTLEQSPSKCPENAQRKAFALPETSPTQEHLKTVDREALIYHPDLKQHSSGGDASRAFEEPADDFFEITMDDVRKRFAELKSERRRLEEAPLITKAMREAQMKEKTQRYPKVTIRVQFPDGSVLQGFFRPLETVAALKQFVKMHLKHPEVPFYLFMAPPKVLLDDLTETLFQANLFPASLVHFGSEVRTDCYISEEFLESPAAISQANVTVASSCPRATAPTTISPVSEAQLETTAEDGGEEGMPETELTAHSGVRHNNNISKVPKWLKLPGKR
uniref:UBX domain-containing protein n=1 Tax=Callorhinchus milii TaxID=7868 RepID=A0A4W3JZ10_CALMI